MATKNGVVYDQRIKKKLFQGLHKRKSDLRLFVYKI